MSLTLKARRQYAVLWARTGWDGNGEPKVAPAREIKVRWEFTQREVIGDDGTPIAVDATVDVGEDIPTGSIMWLGRLADLPDGKEFDQPLLQVITADKIPDIKGRQFARSVTLSKWRRTLPTIEEDS